MRSRGWRLGIGVVVAGCVAAGVAALPAHATWPGRNGEIVHLVAGGGKDVFTASRIVARPSHRSTRERDLRGCYQEVSLQQPGCVAGTPAVSRDGREVAYTVQSFRSYALGIVDRNWLEVVPIGGGQPVQVPLAQASFDAAWSPDGRRLLVTRYGDDGRQPFVGAGSERLFLIDRDGNDIGPVTPVGEGAEADWAANGAIAYVDDGDVWITRIGRTPRRLTFRGGRSPSWAPGGRRLAFERDGQIWTVRADGRRLRRVTRAGGYEPAWSPDGRRIAFRRADEIGGQRVTSIYTMRADGSRPAVRIVLGDSDSGIRGPAWRPKRR